MLVGLANCLRWLDGHVARILVAHFLDHAQRSEVLEVSAGLAVAEVVVGIIGHEAVSVSFVARNAPEDEV
jgi:hypothetical protein